MSSSDEEFASWWRRLAANAGLEVVAPFDVRLGPDRVVRVPVLLKHFGPRLGMLLVTNFASLSSVHEELVAAGYGYSTLSPPRQDVPPALTDGLKSIFEDWGWSGPLERKPHWLRS